MKKKGFTLIELLAVIVILAIIALIAVPTVINIVNNTNKKAFENSVNGLIKAADLYYCRKDMIGEELEATTFEFPNGIGELEVSGNLPTSGTMIVSADGEVALAVSNGIYCAKRTFGESDFTIDKELGNCLIPGILSEVATTSSDLEVEEVHECATNGICDLGTSFAVKVNDEDIYKFYIISDDGEEVSLIMDRNLGEKVAWNSSKQNSDGPLTAIAELESVTNEWKNVLQQEYIYSDDSGENKYAIEEPFVMRARMLTYTEANRLGCTEKNNSCPPYLYDNLNRTNDPAYGYWTSTAYASNSTYALSVYCNGNVSYISHDGNTNHSRYTGVRPVITLSK